MRISKKIGICTAAVAGTALVANVGAKVIEAHRRKWYSKGLETAAFIKVQALIKEVLDYDQEVLDHADEVNKAYTEILSKYNKLCKEYDELESEYNDMLDYYSDDE